MRTPGQHLGQQVDESGNEKAITSDSGAVDNTGRSGFLIPVWICYRCLSHISRWRIDMLRLWRTFLRRMTDWRRLRVGLRWRISDLVCHNQRNLAAGLFVPYLPLKGPPP